MDECRALKPDFIQNGVGFQSYDDSRDEGVDVTLDDGSTYTHDLLVGADGIWSAVRAQMYERPGRKSKRAAAPPCRRLPRG